MATSVTEGNNADPFVIIIIKDQDEEPAVVPKSWLCDDNTSVMWPPSIASHNTASKRVKPKENWKKYEVKDVYWSTATESYQEAIGKLKIAEDTSSEESVQRKWKDLNDPKTRKTRHEKTFNSDDDSKHALKKIKLEKDKKEYTVQNQNEQVSPVNLLHLTTSLPQLLTAPLSTNKPNDIEEIEDLKDMSSMPSRNENQSTVETITEDQGESGSQQGNNELHNTDKEDGEVKDTVIEKVDGTVEINEVKDFHLELVDDTRLEKSKDNAEENEAQSSDKTMPLKKPRIKFSTLLSEEKKFTISKSNITRGVQQRGNNSSQPSNDEINEVKDLHLQLVDDTGLETFNESDGENEAENNKKTTPVKKPTIKSTLISEENKFTISKSNITRGVQQKGNNSSQPLIDKTNITKKSNAVPLEKKKDDILATENDMEEDGLFSPNADETKENGSTAAPSFNNARAGSSKSMEYSALKIDGKNIFKPEEFVNLPINDKINVIGLQQHQIIANQAKIAVAANMKKNEKVDVENGLQLEDTLLLNEHFPIRDPDLFESFDDDLRKDEAFRNKVWQYLQAYVNKNNWKDTVRKMIARIMSNEVQEVYSCCGQKGKKVFNETLFYNLIEVATTRMLTNSCRTNTKKLQTYVSDYLKNAKSRIKLDEEKRANGRKKKEEKQGNKGKTSRNNEKTSRKKETAKSLASSLLPNTLDGSDEEVDGSN
ncbi:hypothetical protein TSAR_001755 [Trichomalopsis sarcophagae]|uniref:DUF4806 domain-containing protein n=1 Tax=Trichomalopsis sarcophagae TaxID=543379 RepID=A0A232ED28_9HYME|nr:hypothetical protein TSAR_001755 [Trichomalopsis sarcophagae]